MQDFIVQLEALLKGLKEAANAAPKPTTDEVERLACNIAASIAQDADDVVADYSFEVKHGNELHLDGVTLDEYVMEKTIKEMLMEFLREKDLIGRQTMTAQQ
jgi:hypothetical protein